MVARYEIVVSGTSSPMVRAAFPGFAITPADDGRIKLDGDVPDEAALHGVLHRLQDLGLTIFEVRLIEKSPTTGSQA